MGRRTAILATLCAGAASAAAGCGTDEDMAGGAEADAAAPAMTTQAAPAPAAKRPTGTAITVDRSRYGPMLYDGRRRAIYLFTRDGRDRGSRCYGDCAVAWPPVYTKGRPRGRGAVRRGLLGTTRRRDGRLQVTYAGAPLYYYVSDTRPLQVTCQAVPEFGGLWYVVRPGGAANRSPR
jgi:predicted lipoprotein with Yx(FWY)xxD motif